MSYYYLISSLPDLNLDAPKKIGVEDVLDTIQRNLSPEDEKQLRFLLYPNDNRNLLDALFKKFKGFPRPTFRSPATLSQAEIGEYPTTELPVYMQEYLDEFEDQFKTIAPSEMEDGLWEKFYHEVEKQDAFIAEYYQFDRQLKELAARQNIACFDFLSNTLNPEAALSQLGNVQFGSASLHRAHPYLEALGEVIASNEPDKIEQCIDQIKWNYLSQISGYFEREQVFVYVLQLLMVVRWQGLDPEAGAAHFKEIQKLKEIHNLKQPIRSSLTEVL